MSWVATAIVAGSVITGYAADQSSRRAADASQSAADASVGENRRQYDQTREDQAPYRQAGVNALAAMNNPDAFQESPGYQFNFDETMRAAQRSQAARGSALSGGAMRELSRYGSGLASNEYGNWWNRQANQAGIGQTSVGQTGRAGMNMAGNNANILMNNASARGNAYQQGAQGMNNAVQGGISNMMLHNYLQEPQSPGGMGNYYGFGNQNPGPSWRPR